MSSLHKKLTCLYQLTIEYKFSGLHFCLPYIHYLSLDNKHVFFPFVTILPSLAFHVVLSGGTDGEKEGYVTHAWPTRVTIKWSGSPPDPSQPRRVIPNSFGLLRKMYSALRVINLEHQPFFSCVTKAA